MRHVRKVVMESGVRLGEVVSFCAGGTKEEVEETYRLLEGAGFAGYGVPVEGLAYVEITVPGRTYRDLDGIREYIEVLKERRNGSAEAQYG